MSTIDVVFDGRVFVPATPVDLPAGTKTVVVVYTHQSDRPAMTKAEAERILNGDGTPLPWTTVEEALERPRFQA